MRLTLEKMMKLFAKLRLRPIGLHITVEKLRVYSPPLEAAGRESVL
jgi:hypothetical protein